MILSRTRLKERFASGQRPDGSDFANLIDSSAQVDELAACATQVAALQSDVAALESSGANLQQAVQTLGAKTDEAVRQGERFGPSDQYPSTPGWLGAAGRIGAWVPQGPEGSAEPLATSSVPADGDWHVVLCLREARQAFEIVASASDAAGKGKYGLTHAVAVLAHGCGRVRQTRSAGGLLWFQYINVAWKKQKSGRALCLRTLGNYGKGSVIRYHLTRLW